MRPDFWLPESLVTPRDVWLDRRKFMAVGASALALGCLPSSACAASGPIPTTYDYTLPEFTRNPAWAVGQAPAEALTDEEAAASYNNYYEFTTRKERVWRMARDFQPVPWTIRVDGLCETPTTFGLEELLRLPLEERVYRFRCVEAWSMVVPWIGFPLKSLLSRVSPLSSARFVRLVTLDDASRYPGVRSQDWYPWPYFEGLSMAEALHDLTMLAVGIYGHPLPNQHGAPCRLVVPWKYGYKNIKAIVHIELVESVPATFWNQLIPDEYDFLGNVRPDIPHPRWSQAEEREVPGGRRVPTRPYNGYAAQVAGLYR